MAEAASSLVTSGWGTPDPRDPHAYPSATASTPVTQWGWEFLRRRSDYRLRWEKLVRPFLNDQQGFDQEAIDRHYEATRSKALRESREYRWQAPWMALQEEFRVSGDSALCNVTLDPRLERPPLFDGTFVNFYAAGMQPEDVAQDATCVTALFANGIKVEGDLLVEPLKFQIELKPPKILIEFDLRLPINLQLENAQKVLARRAKPHRAVKLRTDKFPLYLRLLDFNDAGCADKEIGAHLFPNYSGENMRDNIRKALAAASRWQDGYLSIALHPPDAS